MFDPLTTPINVVLIGRPDSGAGPQPTPGVATVSGADLVNELDAQQGAGTTGAPVRWRGAKLIEFEITIELWLSEHWIAWDTFRHILQGPPVGPLGGKCSVIHPWLAMAGVSQALVRSVSQPVLDESMKGTIKIAMIQYKAPKVTFATAKPEPEKPLDAQDRILRANNTTIKAQNEELAK